MLRTFLIAPCALIFANSVVLAHGTTDTHDRLDNLSGFFSRANVVAGPEIVDCTLSGNHLLLDIIAPSQRLGTSLLANMKQVIPEGGDLRIHPIISKLVEKDALGKLGAAPTPQMQES